MYSSKQKSSWLYSCFFSKESSIQVRRYLSSGLLAALTEYASFYFLLYIFDYHPVAAHSISMFAGFLLSFLLNKYWSFESKEGFFKQFMLTSVLFSLNLIVSDLIIYILVLTLSINPAVSKLAVMGMVTLWNFVIFKRAIFR